MKKLILLLCLVCLLITSSLWASGLSGIILAGGGGTISSVPAAPTGVSATAGNAQNTVTFTASSGSTSCNLYWKSGSSMSGNCTGNGTKVTDVTSPDVITSLTNGTTYYYMLTCQNAVGESSCSSEVSGTPNVTVTVPGAPTSVAATAGNAQNTITWSAPSSGGTPTSYNLYWSTTDMGSTCSSGSKVTGVSSPNIITSLTNGTKYYYMLTAQNSAGEGACSSEVNGTPVASAVNYTAFTNVGSGFTAASSTSITYSSLPSSSNSSYVYYNYGSGNFGANFTHYVDVVYTSASGTAGLAVVWEVSNNIGDLTANAASTNGDLTVYFNGRYLTLVEYVGLGTAYTGGTVELAVGTTYYLSIMRNSSVGTYGTAYCYVYDTSAHRLAGGSTGLLATLTATLHNNNTWQYLYAASSWDNTSYSGTITGSMANLTIVH